VGVALAGRDTGSSQLFVMRARHPHLDGLYPLVGKASGPWHTVIEGDVIKKVRVVER
jgi:cyclophilin family peptidyl-prolyl cis-trans isomerase